MDKIRIYKVVLRCDTSRTERLCECCRGCYRVLIGGRWMEFLEWDLEFLDDITKEGK
jgi:hypothetical protein